MFFEDIYKALEYAVSRLGGAKEIGAELWPDKPPAAARVLLLDCLNRERPHKLDLEQVMAILRWAREAGCDEAKHYLDLETGYQKSQPINPLDEAVVLQQQLQDTMQTANRLITRMERLIDNPSSLLRVAK